MNNAIDIPSETQTLSLRGPLEAAALASLPEPGQRAMTAAEHRVTEVNAALEGAYSKGSELQLTEAERAGLSGAFPDEEVEKRPHDGLLYIPHIAISRRLCDVLGAGQWCMVRRREWIEGTRIYAEYVLKVRGCYVGESVGSMDYHPNNPRMNYSDALEGTRGECIRRIAAKDLNCGSQVWLPAYCRAWESRNGKGAPRQTPPARSAPSTPAPSTKAPQIANGTPAKPVPVSRAERIEGLKSWLGPKANAAVAYLRIFTVDGSDANSALMPNEELDGLNDSAIDLIKADPKGFLARLEDFISENGIALDIAPVGSGQIPASPSLGSAPQPPQPSAGSPKPRFEAFSEWFWDVIVTVPHKGESRAVYIKNPDTIRSLYEDMKGGDYDAQKRLFGFMSHYNPEPWKGNDGKMRQPSEADLQFRKALDDFADYEEAHKDVPQ